MRTLIIDDAVNCKRGHKPHIVQMPISKNYVVGCDCSSLATYMGKTPEIAINNWNKAHK